MHWRAKKDYARSKDQQRAVFQKSREASSSFGTVGVGFVSSRGAPKIDLVSLDPIQCHQQWNGETDRNKHCPGRVGIRDDSHRQGNRDAAGCREALVLPKPFASAAWPTNPRVMATTAGPRTPPVIPCNTSARVDNREAGPKAEDQDTRGDDYHTDRDQQAFRSHSINKLAPWHLTDQTGNAADA